MKWDIDKAIRALENSGISGTGVNRVFCSDRHTMERLGVRPRKGEEQALLWCIGFGKIPSSKAEFHDHTIRGAYLRARKAIRKFSKLELEHYGIRVPQRSKGYLEARKLRRRKKKT